ncbi:MAG: dihydroorotase, partial [Bacteroidota bacterium]
QTMNDLSTYQSSHSWFDLNAHFCDPGNEHMEDIYSGIALSKKAGFTDICLMPGTIPPVVSKSDIAYILNQNDKYVDLYVNASLSETQKGENLTEILDLYDSGASCYSDGDKSIWNTELLIKALEYTQNISAPIFQNAKDKHLSLGSQMHQGVFSTRLGLKGEPSLSEELTVFRDLEILKYSGGNLHFSRISCAKTLELIREAKKSGLSVTCDVGIHHLLFTDEFIEDFDSNFKSFPHYRSERDRKALLKGVEDGTIDAICSNHRPLDDESKQLEFDLAEPGNISLQTFCPSLLSISKEVPLEALIEAVVNGQKI